MTTPRSITARDVAEIVHKFMIPELTDVVLRKTIFHRLHEERLAAMTPEERERLRLDVARRIQEEQERRLAMSPAELIRESGLAHDELDDNTDELLALLDKYGWEIVKVPDDD